MNRTILLSINYSETVIGFAAVSQILPVTGVSDLAAILAVAGIHRLIKKLHQISKVYLGSM
jgi:hypothetical protein